MIRLPSVSVLGCRLIRDLANVPAVPKRLTLTAAEADVRRGLGRFAARSCGLVADRIKIGEAWIVDIRVKSFVPEAAGRLDFLCAEYGFTGPEVVPGEAGVYPLLRRVRYQRPGCSIEISLVLSYSALDRQAETVRNQLQDESSPDS